MYCHIVPLLSSVETSTELALHTEYFKAFVTPDSTFTMPNIMTESIRLLVGENESWFCDHDMSYHMSDVTYHREAEVPVMELI